MLLFNEEDLEPLLSITVNDFWDFVNRRNSVSSDIRERFEKDSHPNKGEVCLALFNHGIILGNLSSDVLWAARNLAKDKSMNLSCGELISVIDTEIQSARQLMNEQSHPLIKEALYSHSKRLSWLRIKIIEGLFDYQSQNQTDKTCQQ